MERYITIKIDRVQRLEDWVQKLTEEMNKGLDGGEIHKPSVHFNEPHHVRGKTYFDGYMFVHMKFDKKEPTFLLEKDKARWQSEIKALAQKRFNVDIIFDVSTYCSSFTFEEPSKEEFYALTENKENIIRTEFERIKNFVKWYCYAVKKYDPIRQNGYFSKLETISLDNQNSQKTL